MERDAHLATFIGVKREKSVRAPGRCVIEVILEEKRNWVRGGIA